MQVSGAAQVTATAVTVVSLTVTDARPRMSPQLARTLCATHTPPGQVDASAVARPPETVIAADGALTGSMASQTVSVLSVRSEVLPSE
jgi:hypothetical protein